MQTRRTIALAMAAALLALPLAGCGRVAARRAARNAVTRTAPAAAQQAAPRPVAPAAFTAADKAALAAEIDAEARDLEAVPVPTDADFNGIDAGLR